MVYEKARRIERCGRDDGVGAGDLISRHVWPDQPTGVVVCWELAAASPDRYRPDLAASLTNLGIRFSALRRLTEALPVTEEAVAIRRELAAASPDRYRPDLATLVTNLAES